MSTYANFHIKLTRFYVRLTFEVNELFKSWVTLTRKEPLFKCQDSSLSRYHFCTFYLLVLAIILAKMVTKRS